MRVDHVILVNIYDEWFGSGWYVQFLFFVKILMNLTVEGLTAIKSRAGPVC